MFVVGLAFILGVSFKVFTRERPVSHAEVSAVGGKVYEVSTQEELKQRINNAKDGDTVKLTQDIKLVNATNLFTLPANCLVTLDLNGKVLWCRAETKDGGEFGVNSSSTLLVKNGTLTNLDTNEDDSGTIILYNVRVNDVYPMLSNNDQYKGSLCLGNTKTWILQNSYIKNLHVENGTVNEGAGNELHPVTQKGAHVTEYNYENPAVAMVGSADTWIPYGNLNDALDRADGGTYKYVISMRDYTLAEETVLSTPNVHVELQGNTITQTDEYKLRLRNTTGAIGLRNGTLVGNLDMGDEGAQENNDYKDGAVELLNMTVTGDIYNDGHPTTITSGNYVGLTLNREITNNISGGTFSGDISLYDGAKLNITDGNFAGNINNASGGTIQISGGKFVNAPVPSGATEDDEENYNKFIKDGYKICAINETINGVTYKYQVKEIPTEALFNISGLNQTYDGTGKNVTVTEKNGNIFDGKITVTYCSESDYNEGNDNWITNIPIEAGSYKIKIAIAETDNYSSIVSYRTLTIKKAPPIANNFNFTAPNNLIYDGTDKTANVEFNTQTGTLSGMGNVTVKYYSDASCTSEVDTKNIGTYYVGITVDNTGTNYNATTSVLHNEGWKFDISKADPDANMFTFTPPGNNDGDKITYDGQEHVASIDFNSNYDTEHPDVTHSGMGTLQVKYSSDGGTTWTDSVPKNAGTYLVGITTSGATNFEDIAAPLTISGGDGKWGYTIAKATPSLDLFEITGLTQTYDGTPRSVTVEEKDGKTEFTGKVSVEYYYSKNGTNGWYTEAPVNAGDYSVRLNIAGAENYEDKILDTAATAGSVTGTDGYITDENGLLKYKDIGNNVYDIKGFVDGTWRQVTYDDEGFLAMTWPVSTWAGIKITTKPQFVANGKGILLQYDLENTTQEAINNFRFFIGGDTQVNGNDNNENIVDDKGTAILAGNGVSFFAFSPQQGITFVPAYYYDDPGRVSYYDVLYFGADPSTVTYCNGNEDSILFGYSPSVTLEPGHSLSYSVCFGVSSKNTVSETIQEVRSATETIKLQIEKATPTASDFAFTAPSNLTYDGNTKAATVAAKDGITGMGDVTVHYYSDAARSTEVNTSDVKNAGTYYVGITVAEGDNYNATTSVLHGNDWSFTVTKATPVAGNFTFTAPDNLTYDSSTKTATVAVTNGIEGMGSIDLHYNYIDADGNWVSDVVESDVKNAGRYVVQIWVNEGANYKSKYVINDSFWNFEIQKATPDVNNFTFVAPNNLIYDGTDKTATVTSDKEGIGTIQVKYSTDGGTTWTDSVPKNAGTYYVGITADEGDNYNATASVLHDNNWTFPVTKATPVADDFNFTAPNNLIYDGQQKFAEVAAFNGVNGMGKITVHYYNDPERKTEISKEDVKDVDTYYVGITVAEGENYGELATVFYEDDWKFTVEKANPSPDFQVGYGGNNGQEPIIVGEVKDVIYGKPWSEFPDILPISGNGIWSFRNPDEIVSPVGQRYVEIVFTPNDADNYDWSNILGYNPDTKTITVKMLVNVVVDKSSWGREVSTNGVVNYVADDGSTSTEVTGNGIMWLKESSYDVNLGRVTTAWYGLDNSSGIFEKGSRFLIRWINKQENADEWNLYNPLIDDSEVQAIPDTKKWLFIAEVIHPDGTKKYEQLSNPVSFYVQLGDDWDREDVEAYFISERSDEKLKIEYISNLDYPEGKDEFTKLELMHFSPYVIYDKDPVAINNKPVEKNEENSEEISPVQPPEKQEINPWLIFTGVAGGALVLTLVLWYFLNKKREKQKEIMRKTFLASLANSIK